MKVSVERAAALDVEVAEDTERSIPTSSMRMASIIRGDKRMLRSSIPPERLGPDVVLQLPVKVFRTSSRYQKASRAALSVSADIRDVETTNWRCRLGSSDGIEADGFVR